MGCVVCSIQTDDACVVMVTISFGANPNRNSNTRWSCLRIRSYAPTHLRSYAATQLRTLHAVTPNCDVRDTSSRGITLLVGDGAGAGAGAGAGVVNRDADVINQERQAQAVPEANKRTNKRTNKSRTHQQQRRQQQTTITNRSKQPSVDLPVAGKPSSKCIVLWRAGAIGTIVTAQ